MVTAMFLRDRRSGPGELPSRRGFPLRGLAAGAAGLVAVLLAGCVSGPPAPTPAEQDFADYKALPSYRAFAVSGGSLAGKLYADGWSASASSIDGASEEAMRQCARTQSRSTLPACSLYAIGNIEVAGASPAELERAKCIYILDPSARSLDDPFAQMCAEAKTVTLMLPHEGAALAGGSFLISKLSSADDGSQGAVVPADLSGSGDASTPGAILLTAEAIRDQLAGNTLAVAGTSYIYLRPDGTAVLRTADPSIGSGVGHWRVNADGYYCARWPKVEDGHESCRPIVSKGDAYEIGDLSVTVIRGNAFGL